MSTQFTDRLVFKNHDLMKTELQEVSEDLQGELSESELVHLYDINFLAGRWKFQTESRSFFLSGTRTKRAIDYRKKP